MTEEISKPVCLSLADESKQQIYDCPIKTTSPDETLKSFIRAEMERAKCKKDLLMNLLEIQQHQIQKWGKAKSIINKTVDDYKIFEDLDVTDPHQVKVALKMYDSRFGTIEPLESFVSIKMERAKCNKDLFITALELQQHQIQKRGKANSLINEMVDDYKMFEHLDVTDPHQVELALKVYNSRFETDVVKSFVTIEMNRAKCNKDLFITALELQQHQIQKRGKADPLINEMVDTHKMFEHVDVTDPHQVELVLKMYDSSH